MTTAFEKTSSANGARHDAAADAPADTRLSVSGTQPIDSFKTQPRSEAEDEREGLSNLPPEVDSPTGIRLPELLDPELVDGFYQAALARLTCSVSPAGLASRYLEWLGHLALSPGKQLQLAQEGLQAQARIARFARHAVFHPRAASTVEPLPHDHRFDAQAWDLFPFNVINESFLLTQRWWEEATNDVPGVAPGTERVVSFVARQLLDHVAPCNFLATNPRVASKTLQEGGRNLLRGLQNWMDDFDRAVSGRPPVGAEDYLPGQDVAVTPGKVVYRNHLIELIQYSPSGGRVRPEPILIVPAWIMKYYILDLSPHNSLVRHLVERGFTVFMISWRNPTREDRDLGMEDYRRLGIMAALEAVGRIVPGARVHATGYCLGGTLLSIAAAEMARREDDRLATVTCLGTQVDFDEAGELMLFISESEVSYLENIMWAQGYLDSKQMAGAFQLLRSNDLIWSRYIEEYLMGERQDMFDLMAWNADGTRLPYRMHSEYLRHLLLANEFAKGQYAIDERPVSMTNVRQPVFFVSTEKDHIAPWRSVYKIHLLADTDLTFALTNGGHNAGIVSEPEHAGRRYRLRRQAVGDRYLGPDTWLRKAECHEGSWWLAWFDWLEEHSGGPVEPPPMGAPAAGCEPLADAPGTYVFQK